MSNNVKKLQDALGTVNSKKNQLINKYQNYIDNLNWHIKKNPDAGNIFESQAKLDCYLEIINDLKFL